MYAPQTINASKTDDVMVYYYNVDRDFFTDKAAWLDQNAKIDQIIVDRTMTAQEIDEVFEITYNCPCDFDL